MSDDCFQEFYRIASRISCEHAREFWTRPSNKQRMGTCELDNEYSPYIRVSGAYINKRNDGYMFEDRYDNDAYFIPYDHESATTTTCDDHDSATCDDDHDVRNYNFNVYLTLPFPGLNFGKKLFGILKNKNTKK